MISYITSVAIENLGVILIMAYGWKEIIENRPVGGVFKTIVAVANNAAVSSDHPVYKVVVSTPNNTHLLISLTGVHLYL